jgi:uncharacterized protein (TIGR01319 family)
MTGVRKSIRRIAELEDRPLLDDQGRLIRPRQGDAGVDYYVSTSSAGGGLQMMVAGLVQNISAASAHRAALGAGAVVLDVIAVDDGRSTSEQITRITELRPDIILMSGGVDGGSVAYIAAIAETIVQANPQPRFGSTFKLPLVYAGNGDAQDLVLSIAGIPLDVQMVENLRPRHDLENLGPAREAIHDLFMNHVMAQAPGYGELMKWVDVTIMPTPGAVGSIIMIMADKYKANIVGVDIGGATTDVFSSFDGTFTRTVSANLGMSYSITNVLEEAKFANVQRWVPWAINEEELCNWVSNKMVRPTTIPQTLDKLILEQALAREALRLSFLHHKSLARKVEVEERTMQKSWDSGGAMVSVAGVEIIDMLRLNMLVGSGGVLSHAPRRAQAAIMLLDAFEPAGITQLAVDSIFMMPHLGVLGSEYPEIAAEVFDKDCLVRLGTCIAPLGAGRDGAPCLTYRLHLPGGSTVEGRVSFGQLARIELGVGERARLEVTPGPGFDLGAGKNKRLEAEVEGGLVGIVFDCRGRPIALPEDAKKRVAKLGEWLRALDVYPAELFDQYMQRMQSGGKATSEADEKGGQKRGGLFGARKR